MWCTVQATHTQCSSGRWSSFRTVTVGFPLTSGPGLLLACTRRPILPRPLATVASPIRRAVLPCEYLLNNNAGKCNHMSGPSPRPKECPIGKDKLFLRKTPARNRKEEEAGWQAGKEDGIAQWCKRRASCQVVEHQEWMTQVHPSWQSRSSSGQARRGDDKDTEK